MLTDVEGRDLSRSPGLLGAELIAGKEEQPQAAVGIPASKRNQAGDFPYVSETRHIDHQDELVCEAQVFETEV